MKVDATTQKAIAQATADDDQIRQAARTLALNAISIAQHFLNHGSPSNKIMVIRAIMPAVAQGMRDKAQDEDEIITDLREQVGELMRLITGDTNVA